MDTSTRRSIDAALQRTDLPLGPAPHAAFELFVKIFLKRADERYLQERTPESLLAQLASTLRFVLKRQGDDIKVRVFNPTLEEDGYESDCTVVETCMRDQPFLLDTLRLLYRTRGIRENYCLHPIIELHRGPDGQVDRFGPTRDGEEEGVKESCMHFEIERIDSPEERTELRLAILDRLRASQAVVRDFTPMLHRVSSATHDLLLLGGQLPAWRDEAEEAAAFLRWLMEDNFIFMGYEEFDAAPVDSSLRITPREGERLGLRLKIGEDRVAHPFPEIALEWAAGPSLIFCGKDELESRVHRSGKIDTVIVRQLDPEGRLSRFRVISGLFTYKGISQDGENIPILRERLEAILAREEAVPGSHLYKAIITGFNSIPVEYLFGADVDSIWEAIQLILSAENRNDTAISLRIEPNRRSAFVLSAMPRRHYDDELREEISQELIDSLGATYIDHRLVLGELDNVIVQFYLTAPGGLKPVDAEALESRILQMARPWEERFRAALTVQFPGERGEELAERYAEAFLEQYTLVTTPEEAVRDVLGLELLKSTGQLQARLTRDGEEPSSSIIRLKIYTGTAVDLTDSLPILDNFGLRVVDQSATRIHVGAEVSFVDVFRVGGVKGRTDIDLFAREQALADALRAVYSKQVDDDVLNRLVCIARLDYRQVDVLRAYIAYARQQENVPLDFIRRVWLNHSKAARLLIELFEVRFDPGLEPGVGGEGRQALIGRRREAFLSYLKGVESAAEDRVLRALFRLVEGTLRTNYFRTPARLHLSFKFDSDAIHGTSNGLRPFREIFVHHNAVEGVHLRGGSIARGGLRWSDRLDDYRTEILDLMRTQMVKNTIIVPVGAKGGFILKKQYPSREIERARADEMYQIFIRGLLDVTDNIIEGKVVHPERVLAYDGEDPYLVVAADKGTAHLSDTANAISLEYGFWLGDAFASGGSKGYDHKKEAITAKGAWECVKRHFREIGIDPERDVFTCAGIGDMSGDVFGNGMLLSSTMKLQAAFNHLHIFIDPDPEPGRSFEERRRLFLLPRSSWEDYDRTVMSEGGGIFRRSAKAIPLTPQMQALFDTTESALSGEQVVRLILKMPVDLLWNGGIGTYVKASTETHADVGDRINDAVRIDGLELRAKIVGEGGNLGFTQAGRIEFARCGGRLNTDATDNSGGVDMSDHEVNLKILFEPMLRSRTMAPSDRDELLVRMTDAVAASVLSHNYTQGLMISLDELRSRENLSRFVSVIDDLEQALGFSRAQERLPTVEKLQARVSKGEGLYRPELAKLGAFMKMRVKNWLSREPRMQGPFVDQLLASYFPVEVRERFATELRQHPLRQQIITTVITNRIVDFAGLTFFQEIFEDTGHTAPGIAMAYLVSSEILGAEHLKRALFELDNQVPAASQYRALIDIEDALAVQCRRLLRRGYDVFEPVGLIERLHADFKDLHLILPDVLPARAAEQLEADFRVYLELGIPEFLARRVASFPYLASGGEIAMLHEESGLELTVAAWLYHAVGEDTRVRAAFELALLEEAPNRWEKSAMAVLRGKLIDLQYRMALQVALSGTKEEAIEVKLARYLEERAPIIGRVRALEQRVAGSRTRGVAPVTVLTEVIQELVR